VLLVHLELPERLAQMVALEQQEEQDCRVPLDRLGVQEHRDLQGFLGRAVVVEHPDRMERAGPLGSLVDLAFLVNRELQGILDRQV